MLGVKQGKKLAPGELYKAAHSENPLERKRAQFAINAKKWHHKKRKASPAPVADVADTQPRGVAEKRRKAVKGKKWTMKEDKASDKKLGIKQGSKRDEKLDAKRGLKSKHRKSAPAAVPAMPMSKKRKHK